MLYNTTHSTYVMSSEIVQYNINFEKISNKKWPAQKLTALKNTISCLAQTINNVIEHLRQTFVLYKHSIKIKIGYYSQKQVIEDDIDHVSNSKTAP